MFTKKLLSFSKKITFKIDLGFESQIFTTFKVLPIKNVNFQSQKFPLFSRLSLQIQANFEPCSYKLHNLL